MSTFNKFSKIRSDAKLLYLKAAKFNLYIASGCQEREPAIDRLKAEMAAMKQIIEKIEDDLHALSNSR